MKPERMLTEWAERLEERIPGYAFPENGAASIDSELTRTVRFLAALVLDALRDRRGLDFVQRLIRAASDDESPEPDAGPLSELEQQELNSLSAAYCMLLSVIGLAEGYHQYRRFAATGSGMGRTLQQLRDSGVAPEAIEDAVEAMEIRLVATAHPTNIFRSIVLGARREIFRLIRAMNEPVPDEAAFTRLVERLRERLLVKGATRFGRWEKPQVLDEVRQVIGYFRSTIYNEAPDIEATLRAEFQQIFGRPMRRRARPLLRFGSWVGGDMDGNPFVNAEVYRRAVELQRRAALELFSERLAFAAPTLSMALSDDFEIAALLRSIKADLEALRADPAAATIPVHDLQNFVEREPFRLKLELMRLKTERAVAQRFEEAPENIERQGAERFAYRLPEEAAADLRLLDEALRGSGFAATADEVIEPLRQRLSMFGFHLASLDLREDSLHIGRAARLALRAAGHDVDPAATPADLAQDDGEYLRLLTEEIMNPRRIDVRRLFASEAGAAECAGYFAEREDFDHVHRLYMMLESARYARQFAGVACTSNLILTMTSSVRDILHALLLLKNAGLFVRQLDGQWQSAVDIVPLFETVPDLRNAEDIMRAALENEAYRAQLNARGRSQLMMLGFSDSNKDGGYFSSNWSIYRAQSRLLEITGEHQIAARFFYGRGGSIGRGGASSRHVADSLPPGAIRRGYDLTEQGEVLSRYYVTGEVARVHLETIVSAALEKNARPEAPPEARYLEAADRLADYSESAYRDLVHENPDLVAYFSECTPREVELVKIGSRPVRRRAMRAITDLRAIPWVFRWFQSRQFIPGWYGLGTGITRLLDEAPGASGLSGFQEILAEWKFMRAILENSSLALAGSNPRIAGLYRDLAGDQEAARRVFARIEDERRTCFARIGEELACLPDHFMRDEFPVLLASRKLKEPWVDGLGAFQVRLVRMYRSAQADSESGEAPEPLREAVVSSIEGVAMGLGATG